VGNSLEKLSAPGCHARVLVAGSASISVPGSGTVNTCFRTATSRDGPDQRLSKCRGRWQTKMHGDSVRRAGRRSSARQRRVLTLIFVRVGTFRRPPNLATPAMTIWTSSAPLLGLHRHRVAASGKTTAASGVMSDPNNVLERTVKHAWRASQARSGSVCGRSTCSLGRCVRIHDRNRDSAD